MPQRYDFDDMRRKYGTLPGWEQGGAADQAQPVDVPGPFSGKPAIDVDDTGNIIFRPLGSEADEGGFVNLPPVEDVLGSYSAYHRNLDNRARDEAEDIGRTLHTLKNSLKEKPAEIKNLSSASGLSFFTVESDPVFARKKIESDKHGELLKTIAANTDQTPNTLDFLRNADALDALALTNDKPLVEIERNLDGKNLGFFDSGIIGSARNAWDVGMLGREMNTLLLREMEGATLTDEEEGRIRILSGALGHYGRKKDEMPLIQQMVRGTVESLGVPLYGSAEGAAWGLAAYGPIMMTGGAMLGASAGAGVLSVPAAVAGGVSGLGAAATGGALLDMMRQEGASIYGTLRALEDEDGNRIDADVARTLAIIGGGLAGGLEFAGFRMIGKLAPQLERFISPAAAAASLEYLQKNPTLRAKIGETLVSALRAFVGEEVTELGQEGVAIAAEEIGRTLATSVNIAGQSWADIGERLLDTAKETAIAMAIPIGVGGGARLARGVRGQERHDTALQKAQEYQNTFMDTVARATQTSEVFTDMPETGEALLQHLADKGVAPQQVFIKPEAVQRVFFQDGNPDMLRAAAAMGITPESLEENLSLGTDVAVDFPKAAAHILRDSARYDGLRSDMRFDPTMPTDMEFGEMEALNADNEARLAYLNDILAPVADEENKALSRHEARMETVAPYVQQMQAAGYSEAEAQAYGTILAANAERMSEVFGLSPKDYLESRLAGYMPMSRDEFMGLGRGDLEGLEQERAYAQLMGDMGVGKNMGRAKRRRALQPEFAHTWGRVSPESVINTYGKGVYTQLRQQFGRGFFAKKGEGVGIDVLAHSFSSEERGGYSLNRDAVDVNAFAEKVMTPHDEFENSVRQGLGRGALWQDDGSGNAVAPGERAPRIAQVVAIDPSVIVGADGRPVDLKNADALLQWLRQRYQGMAVTISDDGQKVEFTRRGLDSSLKRRGQEQRQAYAGLDSLVENAVFERFEKADERHAGKVAGQNIYYSAAKIDGKYYAVCIKIDVPLRAEGPVTYKGHKIAEIEIAPSLYRGRSPVTGSTQEEGAIRGISLSVLTGSVKPSRIEGGVLRQGEEEMPAGNSNEGRGFFQPLNPGVDLDAPVRVVTVQPRFEGKKLWELMKGHDKAALRKELVGAYVNKNTGWKINLTGNGVDHAISSATRRGIGGMEHMEAVSALPMLIENAALVESHKDNKGQRLAAVHRMYAPMILGKDMYAVKLTVKESAEGMVAEIDDVRRLYDVSLEKKMPGDLFAPPPGLAEASGKMTPTPGTSAINLRSLLEDVNDSEGKRFFQKSVHGGMRQSLGRGVLWQEDAVAQATLRAEIKTWERSVDNIAAAGKVPAAAVKMLGQTPLVMQLLGIDTVTGKAAAKGGIYAAPHLFDNTHPNITPDMLKQLPAALADPIAVFDSDSPKGRAKGDIVFMLEVKDANSATVVVPVALQATGSAPVVRVNIAKSAYAKEHDGIPSDTWFKAQAQKNARYVNGQKMKHWQDSAGVYFPFTPLHNAYGNKIATEVDLVKLKQANPGLYQGKSSPRGGMRQMADGRYIVGLFKNSDASTILHETSHFWLEELREAAKLEAAPQWVHEAWAKLQQAYGFDGFMDGTDTANVQRWTEIQERFAREFEAYAREGKAPSWELQAAFNKFRNWLADIYKSVRSLLGDNDIAPEVREVFDALLATQEEIDMSQRRAESDSSMFLPGLEMKPELRDKYARAAQKAYDNASALIAARRLVEQRKAEREFREEAAATVDALPVYQKLQVLRETGIDFESLRTAVSEDMAYKLREKWKGGRTEGRPLIRKNGNTDLLDTAALFDEDNAVGLAAVLMDTPTRREAVEAETRKKVDAWEQEYDAEVEYSNALDEAIAVELEALTGRKQVSPAALRREVDALVGVKKSTEVDAQYKALRARLRSDARAARRAWDAARKEGKAETAAVRAKIAEIREQERMRRAALGAAYRARIERAEIIRLLRKDALSKSVHDDYRQQILRILAAWKGLGTAAMKPRDPAGMPSLEEFMGSHISLFDEPSTLAPDWILTGNSAGRAADLSLEQLREVASLVRELAHQGRVHDKMLAGREKTRISVTAEKCAVQMNKLSQRRIFSERDGVLDTIGGALRKGLASMTGVHFLARALDGFNDYGVNHTAWMFPLQKARSDGLQLRRQMRDLLAEAMQPIVSQGDRLAKAFNIDGVALQKDVTRLWKGLWDMDKVYAVAMNMGNEGNIKALMKGYGWTEQDLHVITARLTAEEWRAVEKTWEAIDTLYPRLNETYQALKGVPLPKVEAKPFTVVTADGQTITLRGGYYPLIFDHRLSGKAAELTSTDAMLNGMEAILRHPNPKSGMTKARQGGALPPHLSLGVLEQHVNDTTHYIAHALPLRDSMRLFNDAPFKEAFIRAAGQENYELLLPWLCGIARPGGEQAYGMMALMEWLGKRGTQYALGANMNTALLQLTSVGNSLGEVGMANFFKASAVILSNPLQACQSIREKSAYMRERAMLMDDTMRREYERMRTAGAVSVRWMKTRYALDTVQRAQFALISALDAVLSFPTWQAAYEKGIVAGLEESDAVARADAAVVAAQGGGGALETPAMMRQAGIMRMLCPFMSFALADFNRKTEQVRGLSEYMRTGNSAMTPAKFMQAFAFQWVLPVALVALIRSLGRDDELPNEEDFAWEAAGFLSMGIPVVRDFVRMAESRFSSDGFKGGRSPLMMAGMDNALRGIGHAAKAWEEDDDEAGYLAAKEITNAIGFFLGLGTPQIWRTLEGSQAYFEDDEGGILAPLLGKPRPRG